MKIISILNDVLGPVMAGPSSSHTAVPGKIGLAVRKLWGRDITHALVIYDSSGSYPNTHIGQGSDFGFTGGLLGMAADHPDFWNAICLAKEKGVDIEFEIRTLTSGHPNEARIDIYDRNPSSTGSAPAMSVLSYSTGGGTFLLVEMDGFLIENDGHRGRCYVCVKENDLSTLKQKLDTIKARYSLLRRTMPTTGNDIRLPENAVLADIELQSLTNAQTVSELSGMNGVIYLRASLRSEP
ncbi:hypothetical protein [Clostridium sp. AM58-1XD]|uniref:hypothetical protein n=1 Tax=Clostridium sp. AM58-1XD TaxID=2292307 RepID=UPI000E4A8553|nr:hypothetical protein [Clostridium sp. AM58-1XD]RGZ00458.1 hypothetical protein DXA13_05355 [Clostridium sp. AM58-1XD]